MDSASISSLLANSRELAISRWRQLAAAIGVTALLGAALWFILIQVAGSAGGDSSSGGLPSKGGIFLSVTIAWAILVTTFVVPMAASTAAIADEGDDSTVGWAGLALRSLPWMWLRLAIPTAPLLLLGMWAINDVFGMFSNLAAQMEAAAASGGAPAEPSKPLSFQLLELLFGSAPMRWAVFATVLGLWFLWSATRATGRDERLLPHAPWRLFGRNPLVVSCLAGISAVVLGPLLGKSLNSLGSGLGSIAGDVDAASAEGASTVAVLVVGMVISAFIGAVAIPWIALFREGDGFVMRTRGDATVDPVGAAEPPAALDVVSPLATADATATAPAPAMGPPAATVQLVDQSHVAAANASAGSWWYLQHGANVIVQVAATPGVPVTPVASDAAGAWLGMHETGQPGAASLLVPAAGWFLLGAWNAAPQPTQIAMRFTLPLDAQPAPQQQAQ